MVFLNSLQEHQHNIDDTDLECTISDVGGNVLKLNSYSSLNCFVDVFCCSKIIYNLGYIQSLYKSLKHVS